MGKQSHKQTVCGKAVQTGGLPLKSRSQIIEVRPADYGAPIILERRRIAVASHHNILARTDKACHISGQCVANGGRKCQSAGPLSDVRHL
jgi:hypothetical protein